MDKCCRICRWFNNKQCKCKELKNNITINNSNDGVTYVEDGYFSGNIEENLGFTKLKNLIIQKLQDEGYIKKNKNINKFDIEDIEPEIIELIDEDLSGSIENYFSNDSSNSELTIGNNDEFYCCYWE